MSDPAINDPYGTDLALTPEGDLAVTPAGGLLLVSGPANCIQALEMRFKTSPGELPLQPDYGAQLTTGAIGAKGDVDRIQAIATGDARRLVSEDPRFLSVRDLVVEPAPPGLAPLGGLAAVVRCRIDLTAGQELGVADLVTTRIEEVTDVGAYPDLQAAQDFDPTLYFADANQLELDSLADLSEQAELADDLDPSTDDPNLEA